MTIRSRRFRSAAVVVGALPSAFATGWLSDRVGRRGMASAASLLMGESDEAVPAVWVRGLGVAPPEGGEQGPGDVLVPPPDCLFAPIYGPSVTRRAAPRPRRRAPDKRPG